MFAATALLLLGSVFVLPAHGQGELDVALESDYGDIMGLKIKSQNETFGSNRYFIPSYKAKWIQAVAECAKIGGVLADVRSRAELDFLQTLSKKTGDSYNQWVGAGALGDDKSFVWISDQSKVGNELWRKDQPDAKTGNCVFLNWQIRIAGLEVFHCNKDKRGFICKSAVRK